MLENRLDWRSGSHKNAEPFAKVSKNLLITATAAGRTAMGCWPAEYVGMHPPLWDLIPSVSSETPAHYERTP